jgi:DNA-binding SARP family transcriptional activator
MLQMRLFGAFELRADGTPVELTSSRAQSLLGFLVLRHEAPQRRDRVAYALWPSSDDRQARTNLRHVLHTLRGAVPGLAEHLVVTPRTLALRDVTADVIAFDEAADPRTAADLYTGDLLDGWYDDWVTADRDAYRRRMTGLLDGLVPRLADAGDLTAAVHYAARARALDPLAEAPYRMLIRLHDALGDRARAVRVYHECAAVLSAELGVAPSAETRALYEALLPAAGAAPPASATTAYVGRQYPRGRLAARWRAAAAGPPHLAVVTGEPGIGKTRLVEEFRQWAARAGARTAVARSYAAEGTLAYAPVAAWLRELGVDRWRGRLGPAELAVLAPLLPELGVPPAPPDPGARLRLFDAAVRALHAGDRPLLLIADDLHAADEPTLQFLHYLLRSAGPLLVAATARLAETDTGHPLRVLLGAARALGRCTDLPLDRLDRAETGQLAARLGHRLTGPQADRLYAATDGNPLFVVEALRAGPEVLTPRVHAVLEARLAQLTPGARDLAGLAAAAGSSVSVDLLATAHPSPVAADLDELWRRQVLVTRGGDTYDFSHDRLREEAYRLLAPAQRRHHHAAIAAALPPGAAGEIARHLVAAGERDAAVDWFLRGARAAQERYADADAAALLLRAAELVHGRTRELEVLSAVPGPLSAAEGYASPRLRTVLERALEITSGAPPAPLLRAQAMAVLSRGDFDAAVSYGARLRELGADDDVLGVEGDFVRGVAAAWRNDAEAAREHLSAAVRRYRPANRAAHLLAYGTDPQVLCLARLAHVHHCLGDPAAARRLRAEALEQACAVGHPFTRGAALMFATVLDLDLGDRELLRGHVADLAAAVAPLEAPPIRLVAEAMAGYLTVVDGDTRAGLARIDATLGDPDRSTAPGVPAMVLRVRLAAAQAAGLTPEARKTAELLLADGVRVWDELAAAVLAAG